MAKTVFWSWQSDLDGRVTREVVRYALDAAIAMISAEVDEADRPSLTSDTQGVAGSPDIVATILRKIDQAAVFVGDVTPIAVSATGKACANPNVLLEMGYANRALSEHRVIQVWNTAFEGASLDKLPFDMRGRRGPMAFHLLPDADTAELRRVRGELTKQLAEALKLSFEQLPPPLPDVVAWQPHFGGDEELWFDRSQPQPVNHPSFGTSRFSWLPQHSGYARIIPSRWTAAPDAKVTLTDSTTLPALLAAPNSRSYGSSRGGAAVYWPRPAVEGVHPTRAVTQWFEKTGEFWGVGGGFLFSGKGGRITLATGYFYQRWFEFLERNCALALANGGSLPIHVRLGVHDLRKSWWPSGPFAFDDEGFAAVEDAYEFRATLTENTPDEIQRVTDEAFNGLAAVYGLGPFSRDRIKQETKA